MFKNYQSEYERLSQETELLKKQYNKISMLRLVTVAAAVICAVLTPFPVSVIVILAAVAVFIYLIRLHVKNEDKTAMAASGMKVMKFFLDRKDGSWTESGYEGKEYISENRPQDTDLDLFGKRSVYQFICAAVSSGGRKKTAERLSCGFDSPESIIKRQDSLKELNADPGFRESFLKLLFLNRDSGFAELNERTDEKNISLFLKICGFVLPPAGLILAAAGAAGISPSVTFTASLIVIAAEFIMCCCADSLSSAALRKLSDEEKTVSEYSRLIRLAEDQNFSSAELKELSDELKKTGASENVSALQKLAEYSQMRSNMIAFVILNSLLMWDIHCLRKYEKWQSSNSRNLIKWTDIIAEFEEIVSFSVISSVFEKCTFPEISISDRPEISFRDMRHILLPQDHSVGNDEELHPSVMIITGSNMSGKSTFLRSVGSSVRLAMAGAPVCADHFRCSVMNVLTSVRTQDSVTEGISAFYAEILRIKGMMDHTESEKPALILIDEIFKGTNTADRLICAKETIKKLAGSSRIVMVTTHDFELCEENYGECEHLNRHFEERYEDGKIIFDYHIREGKCRTTNAQFLLKMAGIIQ